MSLACLRTRQSRILRKQFLLVRDRLPLISSVQNSYTKQLEPDPDPTTDFARMARFLTGTAIGLVLGGGGARGCAHVGMIQAMHEAGIPIDLIGGTSIGAFMGALWADELNIKGYIDRSRDWCKVSCLFFPVPIDADEISRVENDVHLAKTARFNLSDHQHVHRGGVQRADRRGLARRSNRGSVDSLLLHLNRYFCLEDASAHHR